MQMELAFISPCSILCGRHLHFPKVSLLPILQANPELGSRGKPVYKVWGGLPSLERAELKIFDKEKSYFEVATLKPAEDGTDTAVCAPLLSAGSGTIPDGIPAPFHAADPSRRVMGRRGAH